MSSPIRTHSWRPQFKYLARPARLTRPQLLSAAQGAGIRSNDHGEISTNRQAVAARPRQQRTWTLVSNPVYFAFLDRYTIGMQALQKTLSQCSLRPRSLQIVSRRLWGSPCWARVGDANQACQSADGWHRAGRASHGTASITCATRQKMRLRKRVPSLRTPAWMLAVTLNGENETTHASNTLLRVCVRLPYWKAWSGPEFLLTVGYQFYLIYQSSHEVCQF